MSEQEQKLVFLGVGQVARALADQAAGQFALFGTTRSAERAEEISSFGIEPVLIESPEELLTQGQAKTQLEALVEGASVVVSFPPDLAADRLFSRIAAKAACVVYISSTAVYGKTEGTVDESTDVDKQSVYGKARLEAEDKWIQAGASIIRAPGIYGRGSGLHHRLLNKQYRLPGDGRNYVSRIHVDDLATMILHALKLKETKVYLAGDSLPTTHREIVEWLVERLKLPFPESIPLGQCHYTQQGNRKVNAARSLSDLNVVLKYQTFREGYEEMLSLEQSL